MINLMQTHCVSSHPFKCECGSGSPTGGLPQEAGVLQL